jgi:hypothetical protein
MEINEFKEVSLPKTHNEVQVALPESVKRPRIKTRTLVKNLVKETIGNEASQAIIRIFDTEFIGLKLFWLISLLGCGSLCFYLVAQTFLTYLSYPVYTTTKEEHDMPAVFPKVTICNTMPAITEYAYDLIKEIDAEKNPDMSIFNQTLMSELSYEKKIIYFFKVWSLFLGQINKGTFSDLERKKLVHSYSDIILKCFFNGQPCTQSDFNWHWNPLYGNCYVFNSGLNNSGYADDLKKSTLPDIKLGLQLIILNPCKY